MIVMNQIRLCFQRCCGWTGMGWLTCGDYASPCWPHRRRTGRICWGLRTYFPATPSAFRFLYRVRLILLFETSNIFPLKVLAYLRDNYPQLVESEQTSSGADETTSDSSNIEAELRAEFPGLLERAQVLRQAQNPSPPPQWLTESSEKESEEIEKSHKKSRAFPIWALLLALASTVVYQFVSSVIVLGPLIYVINIGAVVIGIVVVYYSLQWFKLNYELFMFNCRLLLYNSQYNRSYGDLWMSWSLNPTH